MMFVQTKVKDMKDDDHRPGQGGAVFIYAFVMAIVYLLIANAMDWF
jgi:hypothetical protein